MDGNNQDLQDRLLTVSEIADEMHAKPKTVYRRIRDGKLRARKEGGRWLMRRSALMNYLDGDDDKGGGHA